MDLIRKMISEGSVVVYGIPFLYTKDELKEVGIECATRGSASLDDTYSHSRYPD